MLKTYMMLPQNFHCQFPGPLNLFLLSLFFLPITPQPYHHFVPESPFLHKISTRKSTVVTKPP